jgi:hypothetical protein
MKHGPHASGFRKHHRDANHGEIQLELEQLGASVVDLSKFGKRLPDLLVGFCGRDYKVEIKAPDGEQDNGQKEFARDWRGSSVVVVHSRQQAREWYLRTRHELTRASELKCIVGQVKL